MQASADILASVFLEVRELVAPGVTTGELDARHRSHDPGCRLCPLVQGVPRVSGVCLHLGQRGSGARHPRRAGPGRRATSSASTSALIKDGWHADCAETLPVGEIDDEAARLLRVTRGVPGAGHRGHRAGRADLGHRHRPSRTTPGPTGFAVVESLVGHGIGRDLHEDPQVPNFRCFTMPDPGHGGGPGHRHRADDQRRHQAGGHRSRRVDDRDGRPEPVGPLRAHGGRHGGRTAGPDAARRVARSTVHDGDGEQDGWRRKRESA